MIDQIDDCIDDIEAAARVLNGLLVLPGECCPGCGQYTKESKESFRAKKILEAIIRQAQNLRKMEDEERITWRG